MKMWERAPLFMENEPELIYYPSKKRKTDGAIIVFPGGGYDHTSKREGEAFAKFLNENGIDSFICYYRVFPDIFPTPLIDARRAVRYVRYYADKYKINPNKIGTMGASAGGHLVALLGTYRKLIKEEETDKIDEISYLPNFQILCYPVITMTETNFTHIGSKVHFLGNIANELSECVSPELIADEKTPNTFIYHTFADDAVSVRNSLCFIKKLKELGVSTEMHIYPEGNHGLALAENVHHTSKWANSLIDWLYDMIL